MNKFVKYKSFKHNKSVKMLKFYKKKDQKFLNKVKYLVNLDLLRRKYILDKNNI
jgi:hypothetical protein